MNARFVIVGAVVVLAIGCGKSSSSDIQPRKPQRQLTWNLLDLPRSYPPSELVEDEVILHGRPVESVQLFTLPVEIDCEVAFEKACTNGTATIRLVQPDTKENLSFNFFLRGSETQVQITQRPSLTGSNLRQANLRFIETGPYRVHIAAGLSNVMFTVNGQTVLAGHQRATNSQVRVELMAGIHEWPLHIRQFRVR